MDIVTNYRAFRQDIESSFKDLIQEFDLELIEPYEGYYLLLGAKCNIRITYDRGDISCQFKQISEPKDTPGYSIWAVYKFLCPLKEAADKSERTYNAKLQLVENSNMVKNLKNVLNGDFSWLKDFIKKQERENKISSFVISNLNMDNPISKKFWSGDVSWQQDIEKYLHENNINL
jgi:hypothetical protein